MPGAGGEAGYWSRVVPLLSRPGHGVIAVDLPADDATAGLPSTRETWSTRSATHGDVVLVAQSMGGFTAPLVCEATPVARSCS